ncbi:MAG: DNRLRE domain-containing protein, partial [Acidimicrobiia bacterium]
MTVAASSTLAVIAPAPADAVTRPRPAVQAKDLPPLASPPAKRPTLDVPAGDFSNPPAATAPGAAFEQGAARRGVKAGATLVRRDGKSEIWDNHNGTSTAIVHAQPSAWRDRAGQTQAVDGRLIAEGDRFKNASGPVRLDLAGATGDGELVAASGDGWSLAFSPAGAAAGRPGEVDGSTIRYRQIAPGMDLEEKVEGNNLKEMIILTELPAPGASGRFRFPLTLSGLTPRTDTDGSIGFVDASGTEVATMPQGIAFDSSGDPAQGTQASTPVHVNLAKVGNRWAVDLSVSTDWLTSRARVAPIFIDPNIVFDAGRGENGSTHIDAFVDQANATTNYNGSAQLDAGAYVNKIGYASYPTGQYNAFLHYDVSPLAGHSVVSATWNGYFLSAAAYPSTFAVAKAAASWSDSTITWNNQPGVTGSPVTGSVTASGQWKTADVTSWVQG